MQTRRLGRTGHDSSLAILGGVVFHFVEENQAGEILHDALDRGVNHLDIAPGYGSAEAAAGPHSPAARDLGVMVIKAGAARPWAETADRSATTWYEPQPDAQSVERGVRFVLSTPGVTGFCTPGDARLLPWALDAAEHFTPMTDDERAESMAANVGDALIFPIPV